MTQTYWIAIIGAVTGVAGLVLGIISAVDLLQKNRVRLRVVPKLAWTNQNGLAFQTALHPKTGDSVTRGRDPDRLAIEIVNLSAFPVTISEVGFGRPDSHHRPVLVVPEVSLGCTWPAVLESRRAVTVYQKLTGLSHKITTLPRRVYVETECGSVKYGRSAAIDWLVGQWEERKKKQTES